MRRIGAILFSLIMLIMVAAPIANAADFGVTSTSPKDKETGVPLENMGVKVFFNEEVYSKDNEKPPPERAGQARVLAVRVRPVAACCRRLGHCCIPATPRAPRHRGLGQAECHRNPADGPRLQRPRPIPADRTSEFPTEQLQLSGSRRR